jgi:succinoglycan biosynthesis transport protein ExoP
MKNIGGKMEELDIRDIIHIIKKHLWAIVATVILFASVSGIISAFFLSDTYASSTTLIVIKQNQGSGVNDFNQSDLNLARSLVNTYNEIIRSNLVIDSVINDLNLDMGLGELRSKISVKAEGNTEIMRITVEDTIPERAREIADSVANVFIIEVNKLMNMENVQVIDTARVPGSPIRPKTMQNIVIAALLGLMLGLGVVFLIEFLDNTIKTQEDVEKHLQLPVIGRIPQFDDEKSRKKSSSRSTRLAFSASTKAPVMEAYKTLRTNLQYSNLDDNLRVIVVTSTSQDEGKSATAANLAVSIAQSNKRVLLIDCDLRRSAMHRIFHVLNETGLTNILVEGTDLGTIIQEVGIPNLHILTSGPKPPNPSELLGSVRMQALLQQVSEVYDTVILDVPPVLPVSDALVISKFTDGIIYVVRYGHIANDLVARAKADIQKVGARVLGVVINGIPLDASVGYGSYYYYDEEDSQSKAKKKNKRSKKKERVHTSA